MIVWILSKCRKAWGQRATVFRRLRNLKQHLKDAMALNIPCVIDCLIDREDKVFPMVSPGAAISEAFDRKDLDRMNSEK